MKGDTVKSLSVGNLANSNSLYRVYITHSDDGMRLILGAFTLKA